MLTIKCLQCEKEIKTFKSRLGRRRFCSRKCVSDFLTKSKSVCLICGKIFHVRPSTIKKGGGKFCSTKCVGKYNHSKRKEVTTYCVICNNPFLVRLHHFRKGIGKTCSKKCYLKLRSIQSSGKNNNMYGVRRFREKSPGWKGGIIKHHGYINININGNYIKEHRLIMKKIMGRELLPEEVVHHKDGNTLNNNPNNLLVLKNSGYHACIHNKGYCSINGVVANGNKLFSTC